MVDMNLKCLTEQKQTKAKQSNFSIHFHPFIFNGNFSERKNDNLLARWPKFDQKHQFNANIWVPVVRNISTEFSRET